MQPTAQTAAAPAPEPALTRFDAYRQVHASVDGWFNIEAASTWDALLEFQRQQRLDGHLLEVGVHHGKSAALLATHRQGHESCVLVDLHMNQPVVERTLTEAAGGLEGVQLLACDSRDLAVSPLIAQGYGKFRWMHIDGEHTATAVLNDLSVAQALLARHGVVCIDDFLQPLYPQISEAVFRYVRENPHHFSLFLCGLNKGFLARPLAVHQYLDFCHGRLIGELERRGVELTLAKTTTPAESMAFGLVARMPGRRLRGPDWDQDTIRY